VISRDNKATKIQLFTHPKKIVIIFYFSHSVETWSAASLQTQKDMDIFFFEIYFKKK